MSNFKDLTGNKYGLWTVLECAGKNGTCSGYLWKCECRCGTIRNVRSSSLISGGSLGCGCNRTVNLKKPAGEASLSKVYRLYRIKAEKRGYTFNLTREEFKKLISLNCYYCGVEPKQRSTVNGRVLLYNGVDRIDNTKGYEIDNVVTSCGICNYIKSNMTLENFLLHIKRIYEHKKLGKE